MSRERHTTVHKACQDTEETEVSARDFDIVRSKKFNLHNVKSVTIARLKTKTTQTTKIMGIQIRHWQ